MSIGKRLRELRNNQNLTQQELAKKIGCSHQSISKYEKDENMEKIKIVKNLSSFFNVTTDYLIKGINNNNNKELEELTVNEEKILLKYRTLSEHDKKIVEYILNMESKTVEIESEEESISNINQESKTIKIYRFPYYDQRAAAGVGQLGRDSDYHMEDLIVDTLPDQASFVMPIVGSSMYNEETGQIKSDSIAFINPKFEEAALNNKVVIVNFHGKIICKRYINKGSYVLFQSDNKQFESENRKSTDDPECKIIGIVLGVIENEKFVPVD